MIQKERKKKNLKHIIAYTLGFLEKERKKLKCVIADTLGFLETFLQKHRMGKSLGSAFEMLNLLNCPVSQFLRDHKVFVRIAKLMLTITLTCLPPSALHFLSMWEIWEKLRRFPGSPSQLAPFGAAQVPLLRLLVLSSTSLCFLGFCSL